MQHNNHPPTLAESAARQPIGEVAIPPDVLVQCPLKTFKHRPAVKCDGCAHFEGLADKFPGNTQFAFEDRYSVLCTAPVARKLLRIEIAGD